MMSAPVHFLVGARARGSSQGTGLEAQRGRAWFTVVICQRLRGAFVTERMDGKSRSLFVTERTDGEIDDGTVDVKDARLLEVGPLARARGSSEGPAGPQVQRPGHRPLQRDGQAHTKHLRQRPGCRKEESARPLRIGAGTTSPKKNEQSTRRGPGEALSNRNKAATRHSVTPAAGKATGSPWKRRAMAWRASWASNWSHRAPNAPCVRERLPTKARGSARQVPGGPRGAAWAHRPARRRGLRRNDGAIR
eukprot:SM000011S19004  [mRNA]  locus=s11:244383:245358:+ [translate_table: standard]